MSYIFISHASDDKSERIRPLVQVLMAEGEPLWIDRPGLGEGNLGLEHADIVKHDIGHLSSGHDWSRSIQSAIRQSGAVLGCLSETVKGQRNVLESELTVADATEKLVTCIVDDLPYDQLGSLGSGLLDFSRIQAPRIDCAALDEALRLLSGSGEIKTLPFELRNEWEKVRLLIASADKVRSEPRALRPIDLRLIVPRLKQVPIGGLFRIQDLPRQLHHAFADHLSSAEQVRSAIHQANTLVAAATDESFPDRKKMLLRPGQLPPIGALKGDAFWLDVFAEAGMLARRTCAALVVSPVGRWALQKADCAQVGDEFVKFLITTGNPL